MIVLYNDNIVQIVLVEKDTVCSLAYAVSFRFSNFVSRIQWWWVDGGV